MYGDVICEICVNLWFKLSFIFSRWMQPALCFFFSCPSSCPWVFPWLYSLSAWGTTVTRIVPVMQDIIRDIIFLDVCPYILRCPVSYWVKFYKIEFLIHLYLFGICPCR